MHPIRSRRMPLDQPTFQVLFALSAIQPAHGATIREQIIGDTIGAMYLKSSSLYVLLKKLAQKNLIEPTTTTDQPSNRQPYHLTKAGQNLLENEIRRLKHTLSLSRSRA